MAARTPLPATSPIIKPSRFSESECNRKKSRSNSAPVQPRGDSKPLTVGFGAAWPAARRAPSGFVLQPPFALDVLLMKPRVDNGDAQGVAIFSSNRP